MESFNCSKCGKCCRSLNKSKLYSDFDRGDGVCIHFVESLNLCSIYEIRPEKCRVIESYYHFKQFLSFEEYLDENYNACKVLKESE